jgi:hypothetical protein
MHSSPSICIRKIIDEWIDFKHARLYQKKIKTLSALGIWISDTEYAETFISFSKKPLCEACFGPIDKPHAWSQLVYCVATCTALSDAHSVNHNPLLVSSLAPEICCPMNDLGTVMGVRVSAFAEAVLGELVNIILH